MRAEGNMWKSDELVENFRLPGRRDAPTSCRCEALLGAGPKEARKKQRGEGADFEVQKQADQERSASRTQELAVGKG